MQTWFLSRHRFKHGPSGALCSPVDECLLHACTDPLQACEVSLAWICIRSIMCCCRASSKMCDLDTSGCTLGGEVSAITVSEEIQHGVAKYRCPSPSCFSFQVS